MRAALGLVAGALLLAGSATAFAQTPGASADVKMANGTHFPDSSINLRSRRNGLIFSKAAE